jgi:hypothetical protein
MLATVREIISERKLNGVKLGCPHARQLNHPLGDSPPFLQFILEDYYLTVIDQPLDCHWIGQTHRPERQKQE